MDEEHEDLGTDPAAAFEALRAEVAALSVAARNSERLDARYKACFDAY